MRVGLLRFRARLTLALVIVATLAPYSALRAQQPDARLRVPAKGLSCKIPESNMTRIVVYAAPVLTDSLQSAFIPAADNFTQLVVERVWLLLKAPPNTLPRGEPGVTWLDLVGVVVTAFRDGKIDARPAQLSVSAEPPRLSKGTALLLAAIDTLHDEHEIIAWPEGVSADSFSFKINLVSPAVGRSGKLSMPPMRIGVPLFSVAAPWEEQVQVIHPGEVFYPTRNQSDGVSGAANMQFVVDTNGRADRSTIRDSWPATTPRLTGSLQAYYVAFVDAARGAIETTQFKPATIGGCPVRQLMQEPFNFNLRQ